MAVTVDYTPAIFNYYLSGISDAIDAGIVTTDSVLYTQTAVIDGVTWSITHEGAVQAAAGTATDTHVITSSDGFSATSVELVNNYTRATLDSEEDWVVFDDNIDSETWTGDFGNFTVTFSDIGTTYTDIFTGTMTTVSGDLLENVNIVVTFEGDSDFPSALEGTAILNGETVAFDSSLLGEPPVVDTVVVDAVAVDAVVVATDTTVIRDSDYIVLSNANLKDDSYPTATFTGNIEANGSVDTYVITAQAGEAFIFDVEHQDAPGEINDSYIRLYDESGTELARNDDSVGGGANESGGTHPTYDSYLEYTFASAGTYTLTVRGYSDANTGTYGINISKVSTSPVNTPAVITAENATISENQNEVSGIATHTDVDINNNDNVFQTATNATATYGTYSVTTDGNWTYSLDNTNTNTNTDVDALNISDALTDTITITAEDGTTESVIVTINGANDAATVSSAVVALDETDVVLTTSGTLTATDVDNIDNTFTASATTGTIGDFAIDVDGNWTFTANAAFNELNVGDNVSETYNVASVDGTPSTVEITINGTNDAATVSSAVVALDETDVVLTTSGTLTATDVDNIDNTFTASATTGTIGDFAIDVDGNWTFTANAAFNELNVGDNVSETYNVASVDGTPSTVEITINGTNDAATVSSAVVALDETDVALTTSGTLTATDVDNIDNTFTASATTGTIGDFAIDVDGNWTFTANAAFNELNVGDNVSETYNAASVDGTPSTVEITINGNNVDIAVDDYVSLKDTYQAADQNIIFVFDVSGSMGGQRLIDAKEAAIKLIDTYQEIGQDIDFSLISFSSNAVTQNFNVNDFVSVKGAIDALYAGGGTNYADASVKSITAIDNFASNGNKTTMFFLSDGAPSLGEYAPSDFVQQAVAKDGDIDLHAIGFDASILSYLEPLDNTDGAQSFTDISDLSTLLNVIAEGGKSVYFNDADLLANDNDIQSVSGVPWVVAGSVVVEDGLGVLNYLGNGEYRYAPAASELDENATDPILSYKATDGFNTSLANIYLNLKAPIAKPESVNLNEDTSLEIDVLDNDINPNGTPISIIRTSEPSHGDVQIVNGKIVYTPDSNYHGVDSFAYTIKDTFDLTSTSIVSIVVNPVNDAPVATDDMATTNEDASVIIDVLANDIDVDDDNLTITTATANNGTVIINTDGTITYQGNQDFSGNDTITYTITDSHDEYSTKEVDVTVVPVNDPATITAEDVTIFENVATVTGTATHTDVDANNNDNVFQAETDITATYGTYSVATDGNWTYSLNNADPVVDALNTGDSLTDTITITAEDGTLKDVNIYIQGVADADVQVIQIKNTAATTQESASIAEIGTDITTGNLERLIKFDVYVNATDLALAATPTGVAASEIYGVDFNLDWNNLELEVLSANDTILFPVNQLGDSNYISSYPDTDFSQSLSWNGANGEIATGSAYAIVDNDPTNDGAPDLIGMEYKIGTFYANPADGADRVEQITLSVKDIVIVTDQGEISLNTYDVLISTNTNPDAGYDVAVTNEDTAVIIDVLGNDTDADGDALIVATATASHGTVVINADSTLTYLGDQDFNGNDIITYTVDDAQGGTDTAKVDVTVIPVNDAALITPNPASAILDETDVALTTSGTLTATDVDNIDNTFTASATTGTIGDFAIDVDGNWTFTANAAFNELNVGDNVSETYNVASVDGTPSTVEITINGSNDAATVSSAVVALDETDVVLTTSGTLTATDVDNIDNTFTASATTGTIGDFAIDVDGNWTFTANAAFNELNVGDNVSETYNVASVDGTPSTVEITINGTNDAATVSSAVVALDETDVVLTTSGTLTATDVDNIDNTFTASATTGTIGDFAIDVDGNWTFTANAAFNELNVGDNVSETYNVASVDGTPSTVEITINGTNDAATVSSAVVALDETDVALTTSGTLTATDVDNIDNTFTASATTGTIGDFAIDVDGNWTFTANAAFNELNVGDNVSETYNVASVDGTPSTVEITINGTNDAATVSSAVVALDETDVALTTSGTLTATDVDNIDNTFTASATTGTIGDFAIDVDGNWTFTANAAFNELNVGDNVSETYNVASVDGTPSTVEITINGINDAATVSSAVVALDETDVVLTTSGTLTATDVDNIDNTFTASATTGTIGDFAIDVDGNWTFTANAAFNELNVGDNVSETYNVASVDGTPSTVEITINGTNDAATVSSAVVALDETDVALTTSGTLTATDVDNIDNTFTASATTGTIGDFAIDVDGNWTFTANAAFNELNVGDNVSETYNVASVDGTPSTVEITINGTNDAATVSSAVVALDETDVVLTTSGTLTATDVDNIDNTFTASATTGTIGDFAIDVDGNWTFTANAAFNELNVGDNVSETYNVASVDGTPSTVEITINGTNDAATVSSAVVALDETDVALTTSGTLTATDVDNIDNTFTASATTGTIGDFAIDVDGNWTFTANAAFNELNVGDNVSETYNVASVDGTPSTVEITINGTSDIDVMIKTVNGNYLDNATIKYILEDVDTNISTLVKEGGIDVVENVAFDEVKIAENDAYTHGKTIADAVDIYDHLVGLNIIETNSLQFHAADVDNNNEITINDAVIIEKYLANLTSIDTFDLIDEQGNRVTQLDINALDSNADNYVIPTWTIVENGDVNQSGEFGVQVDIV